MKAAVLVQNQDIQYSDVDRPDISPGCVRIRIAACGICGSDVPRVLNHGAHNYPIILGHEFSGIVIEIGDNVTSVSPGDHVVGVPLIPCFQCDDCRDGNYSLCSHYSFIGSRRDGGFAQEIVVPEQNAFKISKSIPLVQAATFEPSTVALHGLLHSGFTKGSTVAVLGCGIIGLFTIQWAKLLGAKWIIAISRGQSGLDAAKKLGADCILSTLQENYESTAAEYCHGVGCDYVYETAGAETTMKLALKVVKKKGRICYIGTPTKPLQFSKELWELINRKECWLSGSWMSYSKPFPGREWSMTEQFMADGTLKVIPEMIYGQYPMSDAAAAFKLFKVPGLVKGRLILTNDYQDNSV